MIDLRSDTVTKPTPGMLQAMMKAEVGDDVFREDPTVNTLQEKAAKLFERDSALFCPSGTMTNQAAIKSHTQPGEELICAKNAHIYRYEGGGPAFNSGISVYPIEDERGHFKASNVEDAINPDEVHKPQSRLVVIENTSNHGGGSCWSLETLREIREVCDEYGLKLHLDGARLFNALMANDEDPKTYGKLFDSISICLSKGLGAPVGSLIIGDEDFVKRAFRYRKLLGGGMRQAGYLAAAGIYALDHHVERLKEDHRRAKTLEEVLTKQDYVEEVLPVETNIVVGKLKPEVQVNDFLNRLDQQGVKAVPFGGQKIRMVTHVNIDDEQLDQVVAVLDGMG